MVHPPQEGPGDAAADAGNQPSTSVASNDDGPTSPHAMGDSASSSAAHSTSPQATESTQRMTSRKTELQSHMADSSMPTEHKRSAHSSLTPNQQESTYSSAGEDGHQESVQDEEPGQDEGEASPGEQRFRLSSWRHVEHALLIFITSLIPAPPPENDPALANAVPVANDRAM